MTAIGSFSNWCSVNSGWLASIRPALASVHPQAWGAPPAAEGLAFGAGACDIPFNASGKT